MGKSALFQEDRTDNQSSQPVTRPVGQLWERVLAIWRWAGGHAVGTRKGGRRNCTRMRTQLVCECWLSVLQAQAQAQGRAQEGRTGETLAVQACLGFGARCRIQRG